MFVGSLRLGPSCFVPMTWADPEAQELGLRTSAALFVGFFACQEEDQDQDQEEDGRASRFFRGCQEEDQDPDQEEDGRTECLGVLFNV